MERDPFAIPDRQSADEARKLARREEESDLKWLMASKRGRRIVWRTLDRAGVFRTSFSTNSMQMAFTEGAKQEGFRLMSQLTALCPELYTTMVKESQTHDDREHDDAGRRSHPEPGAVF